VLGEYLCVCLFFRPGINDQTVCQIFVNAEYEFSTKTCQNNYGFLENRCSYTGAIPVVATCRRLFGWNSVLKISICRGCALVSLMEVDVVKGLLILLTPWSRVILEKLNGSQLVKKFPPFYDKP